MVKTLFVLYGKCLEAAPWLPYSNPLVTPVEKDRPPLVQWHATLHDVSCKRHALAIIWLISIIIIRYTWSCQILIWIAQNCYMWTRWRLGLHKLYNGLVFVAIAMIYWVALINCGRTKSNLVPVDIQCKVFALVYTYTSASGWTDMCIRSFMHAAKV